MSHLRKRLGNWFGGNSRGAAAAALPTRGVVVEQLEGRQLMAAQLLPGFQFERVVSTTGGMTTSQTFAPDGSIFYTNKAGHLKFVKNGVTNLVVSVPVDTYAERGLESVELDPQFASNGLFYLYYTKAVPSNPNAPGNGATNQIVRMKYDFATKKAVPGSAVVILGGIQNQTGYHNAGAMHFAPDGKLFVTTGEAGLTQSANQSLGNLIGKVLRLDVKNYPNIVPSDNPYVGQPGKRPEIWAHGFRNPFTFAIKPGTSNVLFVNDVGGEKFEEINQVQKGKNYGWAGSEGPTSNPAFTSPFYSYAHNSGDVGANAAVTGGVFYTGNAYPASYKGKYFFADFANRFIKVLDPATKQVTKFASQLNGPMDLDVGPDGQLYAISGYGQLIYRIKYVGGGNRAPVAEASADKTQGAPPLTVNFSGAASSDPDGDALSYLWKFGDGTTGTGRTAAHTYNAAGSYAAVLTVSDGKGGTATSETINVVVGSNLPTASISVPDVNLTYNGGETIAFSGTATDPEDGALPASAFQWSVAFHHQTHSHPFIDSINGVKSGTFVVPKVNETDPVQWYRIRLRVTDSGGNVTEATKDVRPNVKKLTLATNIPGLKLNLDSQPIGATPKTIAGVVGGTRSVGAPATQVLNGKTYKFVKWSDGGAATHNISFPGADTTLTATYSLNGTVPPPPPPPPPTSGAGLRATYFNNADLTGTTFTRTDANINFGWGLGSPNAAIGADTFSARWVGKIKAPTTGTYTFTARSDNAARVWINNKLIINAWTPHAPRDDSGTIALTAGVKYDIKVEYSEVVESALMKLSWAGPGLAKQIVPATALSQA